MNTILGNLQKRISPKLKEEKCIQPLWYEFNILYLGSRGVAEHHRAYGGFSRNRMIGSFHWRLHGSISLHLRPKYSREEDVKVKSFDRQQKDKSRDEHSPGKSTEHGFHES